ncbi:DivIVA domain-containing protein [Actinophytocola sp.]|uniref:DivIVA domain-containing protein n=1 Tax=Actinophytocola sp. TaxID=1872138 RepID=UPI002ED95554
MRDVQEVVFDRAGLFSSGYDEDQVDKFLDRVADTVEGLVVRLAEKQNEIDRLKHWREQTGPTGISEAELQVRADRILDEARRRAEELVRIANATSRQLETEARTRATRILSDASRQAGTTVGQQGRGVNVQADLAASAVEVGTRIGNIRDALTAELSNLYRVIGQLHNEGVDRP